MTSTTRPRVFQTDGPAAWQPDEATKARSRLLRAMADWGFDSLDDLQRRALDDPEWFWRVVVADLDIAFDEPFSRVVDQSDGKPFPRWFVDGRLNVATLCAGRHAEGAIRDKPAVVYEGDASQCRALTYAQLDREVRRFAANLAALGVRRGDRVVLFLPVVPEAVVAFLACALLGAIVVPAFTGYGAEALATRLRDSGAVLLITADGTTRRGKPVRLKDIADEALHDATGVRQVIVVRHLDSAVAMLPGRDVYADELPADPAPVATAILDANDPLTIIYTSGTTGAPKGIVHSHAGFAVKAAVDFAYGFDLGEDDVIAWIADLGWMLGPLLILGGLQLGATIVLTEGVPTYPSADRLWEIAERHNVTFQGIAPTAARAMLVAGSTTQRDLSSIRCFASTGEAWDEPTWRWLFDDIGGGRRPIVNYSGGTETGGGILVAYPFLPIAPAAFNGPLPGMDVAVLDENGHAAVGHVGELVVRNTWPGMTHAFWQDRSRYLQTYWKRWPDIWQHGDLASVDEHGTWRISGRSDDTIKVSGRRVGPAEIEAALLKDRRIAEVAVVGVPDHQRGQRIVAFAMLADTQACTPELIDDLAGVAARNAGRAFAPMLHVVRTVPKTKNGKLMRRAARARHLGLPTGDLSALDPSTPLDDIPILGTQGEPR